MCPVWALAPFCIVAQLFSIFRLKTIFQVFAKGTSGAPLAVLEDEGTPVDVDTVEQSPALDIEPQLQAQGLPKIQAADKQVCS